MKLVLASRNVKKIREMKEILATAGVELLSLLDFPGAPEVEETGNTFEENARLKAASAREYCRLPALADDSGLAVDALDGKPGVMSARFSGQGATDQKNNDYLLKELAGVPASRRGAAFVCVLALAVPGLDVEFFRGETRGRILDNPRGGNGFGYDPLFLSDDLGVTMAEARSGEKHAVSHRGRAMRLLMGRLSAMHDQEESA